MIVAERPAPDALQLTVMGKDPPAAPQLALERMSVGHRDTAAIGAANMGDGDAAADRLGAQKRRQRRRRPGRRIMKDAAAIAVVEGDAEAVGMAASLAGATNESGKTEAK